MKRNEEHLRVIDYLSAKGKDRNIEVKERNQLKVLKEYAKAHNIDIVKVMHRYIQGISVMNYHFAAMINEIKEHEAGGTLVSVDEGRLKLPIKTTKEGKLYG